MADVSLQSLFDDARRALDAADADLAVGIVRHILQHAPDVIEGHRLLGEAYLNADQPEQAVAAFEAVLRADPENIAAYYGLGLSEQRRDRRMEAIHAFERALEIQPNLPELRTQLLRLYAETAGSAGQFRLSRSGLGRLYARGQMYAQAIDEFRAVLANEPDRDDVRVALAEALWRDGQEDEATEFCRETIQQHPELQKPALILGYLQLAAGHPEGETVWRRASRQDPTLQVAQALFEILPPVDITEPRLPAFDQNRWREEQRRIADEEERRAVEEQQRIAEDEQRRAAEDEQQQLVAEAPVQAAQVAVVADDDFFSDSWLGQTDSVAPAPVPPMPTGTPQRAAEVSDDDLLASLLGLSGEDADDLSDLSSVTPFTLDEAPPAGALPASLNDIGVHEAELGRPEVATPAEQPTNLEPLSLNDAGSGDKEGLAPEQSSQDAAVARSHGELSGSSTEEPALQDDEPQILQPFNLDDLGSEAQPFTLEEPAPTREEGRELGVVQPFSLDDWNLESDDDLPRGPGSTLASDNNIMVDGEDLGGLKPFSLDELSLDALAEDRSDFLTGPAQDAPEADNETATFEWEDPLWSRRSDQPGFDDPDTDSIFAKLMRERQGDTQPPPLSDEETDARFFSMDDVDLRGTPEDSNATDMPFSLRELGVSDDELGVGADRPASAQTASAQSQNEDVTPFSLRDLGLSDDEGDVAASADRDQAAGSGEEIQPFSLDGLTFDDDLKLDTADETSASEGATPFTREDIEGPRQWGSEAMDVAAAGGTDFDGWPEAKPVEPSNEAGEDGIALDVTPFSFAELGLDETELDSIQTDRMNASTANSAHDVTDVPEITPFSLAELGLGDDDFADLDIESNDPAALPPLDQTKRPASESEFAPVDQGELEPPFSLAELGLLDESGASSGVAEPLAPEGAAGPGAGEEEETTPFSLADLGLSDEELTQMGVDVGPDGDEQGMQDFSPGIDEETTPFSLADLGLSDEELELYGVTDEQAYRESGPAELGEIALPPFPAMDHEREQHEGTETRAEAPATGAVEPARDDDVFSLADLGLGDDELAFDAVDAVDAQEQQVEATPLTTPIRHADAPETIDIEASRPQPAVEATGAAAIPARDARTTDQSGMHKEASEAPPELRRFYEQLLAQPENHSMRLALARMSERRGDVERAIEQYRELINRGQLLDAVTEDLQEIATGGYDRRLLRRLHRLLGDAYMKQDRYQEAMDEYSWT